MESIWRRINAGASNAFEAVRKSLVQIVGDDGGLGAGTIWHSDGLIITNAHVALSQRAQRRLQVVLQDGEQYPAQILAHDKQRDLAALAINERQLPTIAIGHSHDLRSGQWLMALGHPWGVLDAVTAGVVIGTGNNLPQMPDHRPWIALDMKMRPGHSGGPLFNNSGEIVGINTMIQGPEVSFAVPVNEVKVFLKESIGAYRTPAQAVRNQASAPDVMII